MPALAMVAGESFNVKCTAKIDFPICYADADIGSLKSRHKLFDRSNMAVLEPRVLPAFAITYNHCNISPTPMVIHESSDYFSKLNQKVNDPTSVGVTWRDFRFLKFQCQHKQR